MDACVGEDRLEQGRVFAVPVAAVRLTMPWTISLLVRTPSRPPVSRRSRKTCRDPGSNVSSQGATRRVRRSVRPCSPIVVATHMVGELGVGTGQQRLRSLVSKRQISLQNEQVVGVQRPGDQPCGLLRGV
jgi:hypothetical protein